MAKTKNKKQEKIFRHRMSEIEVIFPQIKVTKWTDINPGKSGRNFLTEINLPSDFKLLSKRVKPNGEICFISFHVKKKFCTDEQHAGVYEFSA